MSLKNILTIFLPCLLLLNGCGKLDEKKLTVSEAHEKFLRVCKEDYELDVKIFPLKNTVWFYLPMDHAFYEHKASPKPPHPPVRKPEEKMHVNFLDTDFENNRFIVKYDIAEEKIYPAKDPGYTSSNNEEFSRKYRRIFEALLRSYFDVEEIEGAGLRMNGDFEIQETSMKSYVPKEHVPDFFVIVIADITTGLKIEYTLNLDDYKRYANNSLPYEEFSLRMLYEMSGDTRLLNDAEGKGLQLREITWPEFLSRQIKNRINFKYGQSHFPPGDDTQKEILNAAAQAVMFYDFKDFDGVTLEDLHNDTTQTFSPNEVRAQATEEADPSEGRFHVIEFFKK